jgi:Zn finger protein HypA/HybF involved in hydrogenase expression
MGTPFRGECPKCEQMATHEEFFRERRSVGSMQAASRGDFRTMHEYSFRCSACGQRNEKVVDDQGLLHKWQGNRHVAMKVAQD